MENFCLQLPIVGWLGVIEHLLKASKHSNRLARTIATDHWQLKPLLGTIE
jgi:hypothetical protein